MGIPLSGFPCGWVSQLTCAPSNVSQVDNTGVSWTEPRVIGWKIIHRNADKSCHAYIAPNSAALPGSSSFWANMENIGENVAVIGLGALGLVTVKNLMEAGFHVTGFDKCDYIGGLWHFTEEDHVSVLRSTVINISKERMCFTDFPFPHHLPEFCTAQDVDEYLNDYAKHFNLVPCLRLGTAVVRVARDMVEEKWVLELSGEEEPLFFDRVVIATGVQGEPIIPTVSGLEQFRGDISHSRAFKNPENFRGKRVVVAGLANTGSDTVEALRGIAKEIFISHNHGTIVFPRFDASGRPYDHDLSNRKLAVADTVRKISPTAHEMMMNLLMKHMQNGAFTLRPEFRLSPAPSFYHALPTISDTIVRNLDQGHVVSIPNIAAVRGPSTLELTDGTKLDADSIIWCTGYRSDYSILDPSADPTRHTTSRWKSARGSRGRPLARLYQNIFSPDFPESLAFMGVVWFPAPAFSTFDLAAMAVAQVWAGRSTLPPKTEMNRAIDEHHAWLCTLAERGSTLPGWVKSADWLNWAHGAAGTGLDTRFGWGLGAWKFWWHNQELYRLLSDGIISPHAYRLFEGKRRIWPGALAELRYVNREKLRNVMLKNVD